MIVMVDTIRPPDCDTHPLDPSGVGHMDGVLPGPMVVGAVMCWRRHTTRVMKGSSIDRWTVCPSVMRLDGGVWED